MCREGPAPLAQVPLGSHVTSHRLRHFLGGQKRLTVQKTVGPDRSMCFFVTIPLLPRRATSFSTSSHPVLRKGEELQPDSGEDPGFTSPASFLDEAKPRAESP